MLWGWLFSGDCRELFNRCWAGWAPWSPWGCGMEDLKPVHSQGPTVVSSPRADMLGSMEGLGLRATAVPMFP